MLELLDIPTQPKVNNPALGMLQDISPPADISWWPQTTGWQLIALLIFCYVLYLGYLRFAKYMSNAYRRVALSELETLTIDEHSAKKLPQLLRRVALYGYQRTLVTPFTGREWESWLDQQCSGADFTGKYQGLLAQLAYSQQTTLSPEHMTEFSHHIKHWIKHHRGQND